MKYHIITFGCQANMADSERIEKKLKSLGHKKIKTDSPAEALAKTDLIVINACSVRQSAIDRVYGQIRNLAKLKARNEKLKIILAGCLLEADKKKLKNKVTEIWHPDDYFDLIPEYPNSLIAHVPIMTGCNNFCTYCAVPYTRGQERSRPAKEIVKEVQKLVRKRYREIWLLGQNVNSYHSGPINFSKLLRHLDAIADKCSVRFTSPHPKDFSDELIKVISKSKNIAKNINLPVQSGDNEILQKMNRNYTREQYTKLVNKIRKMIPDIKISTDVIVGFPGETRQQFQNTVNLFQKIKFDKAYISRYSPRPGTTAALTMKDNISPKEKKRRWKILNELVNKNNDNKKPKIIVVLGPTASGKSALAVHLAKKFNGEIISADSRQTYKGMDIGTGKIIKKETRGIKHHLLSIASPKKIFTAIDYKKHAEKALKDILERKKLPVICGGTGFYIHALFSDIKIPEIKPNWRLRRKLEKKSAEALYQMLKKLDQKRALSIDPKNKRRLTRAIEISTSNIDFNLSTPDIDRFEILWLGIKQDQNDLKNMIGKRIDEMIKSGLEREVKKLIKKYGWTKVLKNTIGYQEWREENSVEKIKLHTLQYAKRQMTWFKKYVPKTNWIKNKKEAEKLVSQKINS